MRPRGRLSYSKVRALTRVALEHDTCRALSVMQFGSSCCGGASLVWISAAFALPIPRIAQKVSRPRRMSGSVCSPSVPEHFLHRPSTNLHLKDVLGLLLGRFRSLGRRFCPSSRIYCWPYGRWTAVQGEVEIGSRYEHVVGFAITATEAADIRIVHARTRTKPPIARKVPHVSVIDVCGRGADRPTQVEQRCRQLRHARPTVESRAARLGIDNLVVRHTRRGSNPFHFHVYVSINVEVSDDGCRTGQRPARRGGRGSIRDEQREPALPDAVARTRPTARCADTPPDVRFTKRSVLPSPLISPARVWYWYVNWVGIGSLGGGVPTRTSADSTNVW